MAWRSALKMPRPTKFMHFMSLRTGTALILLTQIINKVTAVYGILALLTGFHLSAAQLSMYIYSLPVLIATIYFAGPVRAQSAWHCLAFAYLYVMDSIVNAAYTAMFGVTWFVVLASKGSDGSKKSPSSWIVGDTSGINYPQDNITHVEVLAAPKPGIAPAQSAIAVGVTGKPQLPGLAGSMITSSGSMSIFMVCGFWLLRFYAILVVLAYARQVLRHQIQIASIGSFAPWSTAKDGKDDLADDPFSASRPQGEGLKGQIGRLMVGVGRRYWLGREQENRDYQMLPYNAESRRSDDVPGVIERERRRRSGTGPPAPPTGL
ncbi:DUF1753-domain-containing protein, partial [Microthyrium microscopicum]